MSRAISNRGWGPSHQHREPPPRKYSWRWLWKLAGFYVVALFAHGIVDPGGENAFAWGLKALLVGWVVKLLIAALADGRIPVAWFWSLIRRPSGSAEELAAVGGVGKTAGEAVRKKIARLGGGAYLGVGRSGGWVLADSESAVMVLGPPRSGKTSAVMIPAVMGAPRAR